MLKTTVLQVSLVVASLTGLTYFQPRPDAGLLTRSAYAHSSPAADDVEEACAACAGDSPAASRSAHASNCIQPLLGTWELHDKGLRTITVNPDGTATMDVKIDNIARFIYGRRLSMDLEWTMSDGVLSYSIVGGNPDRTVGRVINNFGRDFQYRIVGIRDDAIELEDVADPGTVYEWASVAAPSADQG
jgi:hypothetical protein